MQSAKLRIKVAVRGDQAARLRAGITTLPMGNGKRLPDRNQQRTYFRAYIYIIYHIK